MNKLFGKVRAQHRSSGFTLVELVVVVAVIGVLAAVAAPRLIDVGADARLAQLTTTAKTTSSLSAANYSARAAGGAGSSESTAVASCANAASVWLTSEGTMPDNAVVTADALFTGATAQGAGTTAGETETCYLYSKAAPWIEVEYTLYTTP